MRYYIFASLSLIFAIWIFPRDAFAGYAQLAPPPGLTSVGGVSQIPVGAAANGARYAGGHVLANASLNVGARTVVVPVGLRVAANAATFTATKLNPWLAGASLAAAALPFVADMLDRAHADDSLLDLIYDPATETIRKKIGGRSPLSGFGDINDGGIDFQNTVDANTGRKFSDWVAALQGNEYNCGYLNVLVLPINHCPGPGINVTYCRSHVSGGKGQSFESCPAGGIVPMVQPVTYAPATSEQISAFLSLPIDPRILPALDSPIPVDPVPVINPSPEPTGNPLIGPNGNPAQQLQPSAQPLRFPDGDPVPNPNTNPQTYTQPWHEVWPSPTPSEPWRVDVRPTTTIVNSPTPAPDPVPNPNPNPNPNPTGSGQTDCEKFPGSLGCAPLGTPPTSDIPTSTREITLQTGPTFSGGGCPADVMLSIHGMSIKAVDVQQACGWVSNWVKPIILLLAAISAVFIVYPKGD